MGATCSSSGILIDVSTKSRENPQKEVITEHYDDHYYCDNETAIDADVHSVNSKSESSESSDDSDNETKEEAIDVTVDTSDVHPKYHMSSFDLKIVTNYGDNINKFRHKMIPFMKASYPVISVFPLYSLLSQITRGLPDDFTLKTEMHNVLCCTSIDNDAFTKTYKYLVSSGINIFNFIVLGKMTSETAIDIKTPFSESIKDTFTVFKCNTGDDSICDTVNRVVAEKTKNKIPNIVDDSVNDACIVLASVLHFSLEWMYPFDSDLTSPKIFYSLSTNQTRNIDTMQTLFKNQLRNYITTEFSYIEFPYKNSTFVMGILVPTVSLADCSRYDIAEYDSKFFNEATIKKCITKSENSQMGSFMVNLPKFTIRNKVILNDLIKTIGGANLFDDFYLSNMLNSDAVCTVTKIIQHVIMSVTETKTEFVSATVGDVSRGVRKSMSVKIQADHRFYYHVYDTQTKIPLVSGIFDNNNNNN
jgi:hypothetical protein